MFDGIDVSGVANAVGSLDESGRYVAVIIILCIIVFTLVIYLMAQERNKNAVIEAERERFKQDSVNERELQKQNFEILKATIESAEKDRQSRDKSFDRLNKNLEATNENFQHTIELFQADRFHVDTLIAAHDERANQRHDKLYGYLNGAVEKIDKKIDIVIEKVEKQWTETKDEQSLTPLSSSSSNEQESQQSSE